MMGLMLGLIIGVAAFNIISALIMVVMEKQSEVAILKTQGMTDGQVMGIFMVQGASSGCLLYTSPSPRDRQKSRMPSSA